MFGTLFWICLFSGLISVFSPCLPMTVSYKLNRIDLNLPVESAYWVLVCSCSWHIPHAYVTPLLSKKDMPHIHAQNNAVIPSFRSTKRQLSNNPKWITAYNMAIHELVQGSISVLKLESNALTNNRKGQGPEPTRVPPTLTIFRSFLGVLLRFSENSIMISGDIKESFIKSASYLKNKSMLR